MQKIEREGLIFFQFETLKLPWVTQAVFSRHGGVSPKPWESLNLGGTVDDDPERVAENLAKLVRATEFQMESLVQVRQIHSANVITAREPMDVIFEGDAILTNKPGLLLLMRFADCVPILIVDPLVRAVGIAHAGWQGTVKEVGYHVVKKMEKEFGSDPKNLYVGIGPSIGPDHYQVGDVVAEKVREVFGDNAEEILLYDGDGVKFDLWEANRISLTRAGVRSIEVSGICTACNRQDWYSHRAEKGKTGRFGAVIGLH